MDKQLLRITWYATVIYLIGGTLPPAGAVTEPSWGNGTHFCGVSDYHPLWRHHSKRRDNRNYARPFASNQNVGEPRTVRMIYFLPNDRPYQAEVVQRMKDEIRTVQRFFAEQMEAHGYGRRTFRVETDAQGEPVVHRMDGQHPDSYYLDDTHVVYDELTEAFNHDVNIYLTVIDISTEQVDRTWAGTGARWGKQGGQALVANFWGWYIVAHELGHAFGLLHDFRDGEYIMSYGHLAGFERWRLSACHAENLSVHPYFNANIPIEEGDRPYADLISPHFYPSDSKSVSIRVRVSDPDGLHQVILHAIQPDNRSTVKQCRGLAGRNESVIEFDYDGVIPSSHDPAYSRSTSLLSPLFHPLLVEVVDAKGDGGSTGIFLLFSEALEPLSKISGDNQHGFPNTPLPVPFVVELWDLDKGSIEVGVPISFTVTAGGGSLSVLHTETDRRGRAESVLTLGPNLGTNTVTVSAAGIEGTVTFTAVATAPVKILDLNLRAAIEAALQVPPNTPIAPAAMATLTGLNAPNSNISDLTGLEHATSLRELYLWDNNITDISPLAGLTNLFALSLWDNNISDISVVAGLTNLAELSLGGNSVTDVSPVMGLTNLTSLHLPGNDISDISSVAGLVNLTYLNLNRTNISDISPVAGLTHLTDLYLGENNITDISHLTGLTDLRLLWLQHTNISDLSALVANTGLGSGDEVKVDGTALSYTSIKTHIPTLRDRGVMVSADNLKPSTLEYLWSIPKGMSLIHVPLEVTAIDGVATTIVFVSDLYDALGGSGVVLFLITYDPSTQEWPTYSDKDTSADHILTEDMGIIAGMAVPTKIRLSGNPLGLSGSSTITLNPGFNLVGLPLKDPRLTRVSDLLRLDGIWGNVAFVTYFDDGLRKRVDQLGDDGDIPLTGGQGFILIAHRAAKVTISGDGWTNTPPTAAASSVVLRDIEVRDTTPVLALKGAVVGEHGGLNQPVLRVTVKNLSTDRTSAIAPDEAGYRFTWVDIETGRAARIGDTLEISARSADPLIGVEPLRYTITAEDVKQSCIQLPELVAYEIPKENQLLSNYPNPFNPETWIPYRLAEDAFVSLTIYDLSGRVVRSVDVGHRIAAVYENRSKAVYWDGRNEFGEIVASGVYFYHLSAGNYSATRKMLIIK